MTSTDERLQRERAFHDEQALGRRASWLGQEQVLAFDDDTYLDHEPWIRPALAALGVVAGQPVLDLGCGHGMASVVLARRGARVTGLELSGEYLAEARVRGQVNGVAVNWVQADAENLPFADGTFACAWGNAVLHHLDLSRVAREIYRVLRPGGRAVFCEPWGENPLLNWVRRRVPGRDHTADEEPLRRGRLQVLRQVFPSCQLRGFQVLGMATRFVGRGRVQQTLDWCDEAVLRRLPGFESLCRYVVLELQR